MRTTLNIDDEVLEYVKLTAKAQNISVGDALSRLARRGMDAAPQEMQRDPVSGFWMFPARENTPKITSEGVRRILDEEDDELVAKYFPKR